MKLDMGMFRQLLALMTVICNELSFGMAIGWTTPMMNPAHRYRSEISATMEEKSWIASIIYFGAIMGLIAASLLLDVIGRKLLTTSAAFTYLLSWIGIALTRSTPIVISLRFIAGLAMGLGDGSSSLYVGEVCSPFVRNIFGNVLIGVGYIGMFIEYVVGTYLSYKCTVFANIVVSLLGVFSVYWLVETPQFLLMKGKEEKALDTFIWLYGVTDSKSARSNEFNKVQQNVKQEMQRKQSLRKKFTSVANYKSLFIVVTIYTLVGATGYYVIPAYATLLFSPTDTFSPNDLSIILGLSQLISIFCSSFVSHRFNRRPLTCISFSCITVLTAAVAALYYVHQRVSELSYFPWIIFITVTVCCTLQAFVFQFIYLIRGELFPLSIKPIGCCLAVIGEYASSWLMCKIFLFIASNFGVHWNFILFSALSLFTLMFTFFALPETNNKTLIEIQQSLEKPK